MTGDYWTAGAISTVHFAIYHLSLGSWTVVSLFFVALGLQWLVKVSGGLYIAIAVHFAHNLVNGFIFSAKGGDQKSDLSANAAVGEQQ